MRRLGKILISVAAILTLTFVPVPALASTIDDLGVAEQKLSTAVAEFLSDVESASSNQDVEALNSAVSDFKVAVDGVKAEYARISREAKSDGWRAISDKMTKAVNDMSSAASEMQSAIVAQDAAALSAAGDKFDTATGDYDKATDEANEYMVNNPLDSGDTQWALWFGLLAVSVLCLVAAIIVNFLTRKQHGTTTNKAGKNTSLKEVRRNILVGAGIFVVGAAIPAVQYWWGMTHRNDDGSFTYYTFWYPLAIGAILFIGSAFRYVSVYLKVKKSGSLAHADNAAEMASVEADIKVPKIGSKANKK